MRTYSQIAGDGGSGVVEQIADLEARIAARLAGVKHLVAIGSGKGGVGKSTLTRQLAAVLASSGKRVGILDADLNGPSQARLGGVADRPPMPADDTGTLVVPKSRDGISIFSVGSFVGEGTAFGWPDAATAHSHVWRATREFARLAELLSAVEWGALDVLLIDLPPGPERTAQFASFFGAKTDLVLVTIPTALARGVVARSVDALKPLPNRILGYVENMSGYACGGCGEVRPLFPSETEEIALELRRLGRIPFDPELARLSDRGLPVTETVGGVESGTARTPFTELFSFSSALFEALEETNR
jgi:ATP-binding protein involved in chromosome partitioning